jgi:hypothetical protein
MPIGAVGDSVTGEESADEELEFFDLDDEPVEQRKKTAAADEDSDWFEIIDEQPLR